MDNEKAEVEPTLQRYTGRLLTANKVAEILVVDPSTVRRWAHEGKFEYIHIGGIIRIRGRSLDRYLYPDEAKNEVN